jgi:hypothetical protein
VHHGIVRIAGERQVWELPFHPFNKHIVQKQIRQDWTQYASNNVAKKALEFSSAIERKHLKVRYGEGFGGAPLRLLPAMHRLTAGAGERSDEQATEPSSKTVGGNRHV